MEGDTVTVAGNPIRDVIFQGNEEIYQLWGQGSVFLMNTGMTAAMAGSLLASGGVKALLLEGGKIVIADAAGEVTAEYLVEELGIDPTSAMLAGIAVTGAAYGSLGMIQNGLAGSGQIQSEVGGEGRAEGKGSIDSSNSFYKQGGGSNLDDFMTPHAQKHVYNPDIKSTRNKTQFGENTDVAKLLEDTLLHPDKVIYDSEHNMIKYIKEYDFNISTLDTPTGSHRVFINLDPKVGKTNRNSQFPYYGGNK